MIYKYADPVRDAEAWIADQERALEARPVCEYCGDHIQEDYMYEIFNGELVCPECLTYYLEKNGMYKTFDPEKDNKTCCMCGEKIEDGYFDIKGDYVDFDCIDDYMNLNYIVLYRNWEG